MTQAPREREGRNTGLDHVARLLNLLALRHVTPAPDDVVAVLYGAATPAALAAGAHQARFGGPNPNAELLRLLRERGVAVEVCGQALAEHGFRPGDAAPEVTVALSAQIALANRQLRGWAVLAACKGETTWPWCSGASTRKVFRSSPIWSAMTAPASRR
ncbi:DsrE family protein [Roseomonas sp. E05]|uniref:DsrE family protein n=1 Tax=Roseomonas sp. E05 TaxID=3046310 RepID=UPI0024BA22BC|nr:DsrE family protein [Roseomonas sp. E05]MDJ0391023.1 DsrE family protein [Roseomonas sp. E05]